MNPISPSCRLCLETTMTGEEHLAADCAANIRRYIERAEGEAERWRGKLAIAEGGVPTK